MDIQEADIAAMGREELEALIDRAVRPDVPLRVLFAALDRYTELLRPVLDDEAEPTDTGSAASASASADPAGSGDSARPADPAVPRHTPSGLDSAIP